MTSRLLFARKGEVFCLSLLTLGIAFYAVWVLRHMDADPAYRTLFIEEFHAGEAGRTRYLFGSWVGEGGGWQSLPFAPLASVLAALSYGLLGHSLMALRVPFVLLDLASIALFAMVCWRAVPGRPWLAVGATAVFTLSPFFTVLRPTSNNENLYPFIAVLLLIVLSEIEKRDDERWRAWLFGIAGFIAGSALLVKVDGVVLPMAIAIAMALDLISGRIRFTDFVACGVGGIASILLFVGIVCMTMGWREAVDSVAYSKTIIEYRAPKIGPSIGDRLTSSFLTLPKNLDVYFPYQSFLLIPGLAVVFNAYARLNLAARFCFILMLTLFVWSAIAPLMYWKKATIAAVPLLFVYLIAVQQMLDGQAEMPRRQQFFVFLGSSILALAVAASSFQGMTRLIPFWAVKAWNTPEVWAALAGASILLFFALFLDFRRLTLGLFATVAGLVVVSGIEQVASFRPRHDLAKIGKLVAAKIGSSNVVSDHNGYRFVSAFSDAHFRFFHENDPLFPAGITSEAQRTHPPFVLVTNTYKPVEKQIDKDLPDYRKILRLDYWHPMNSFNDRLVANTIVLYERR